MPEFKANKLYFFVQVVNKIDLPGAEPEQVLREIEEVSDSLFWCLLKHFSVYNVAVVKMLSVHLTRFQASVRHLTLLVVCRLLGWTVAKQYSARQRLEFLKIILLL